MFEENCVESLGTSCKDYLQGLEKACIAVAVLAMSCASAAAQDTRCPDDAIGNPPTALLTPLDAFGNAIEADPARLAAAGTSRAPGGIVSWTADIAYAEGGKLYNPRTDACDTVRLRSYQGPGVDPETPFVAPTFNVMPGETLRITLNNKLPADDPSCVEAGNANVPHCFNSTNLHTHGLWISPTGNSDNVLLTIRPNVSFTYEYNIPQDHPAGTFWYHPHLHGSTALQVSSGMAGALIVRGDRLPAENRPGDIDTLLREPDGAAIAEQVLLFQQIPYACFGEDGRIKTDAAGLWVCDEGDTGVIETYNQFGRIVWKNSGRYTSINGQVTPTMAGIVAGQPSRWRLIHAGVRDSIKAELP